MSVLTWRRQPDKGGSPPEWDEVWSVLSYTPPEDQPAWVGLASDKPELTWGRLHPTVTGAYVTKFDPKPIGTSDAWEVTVSYRIGDPEERDLPPTQRSAVIECMPEAVPVPTLVKQDGKAWVTAAGELLAGITRNENHVIFSIQKNVDAVPAWSLSYSDAVNSDSVNIRGLSIAAHYLMLADLRVGNLTPEVVNGIRYLFYPVSFSLIYNPRKWITKALHRGYYQINTDKYPDTDGFGPCVGEDGQPSKDRMFLDANGKQLGLVGTGADIKAGPVDPTTITTIDGWNHELLPFSALPLS